MFSSFLGQRGYVDDEEPGMVGLKCEVDGAVGRGLVGEVDGKGILDFEGERGLREGKAAGRGRGTVDL